MATRFFTFPIRLTLGHSDNTTEASFNSEKTDRLQLQAIAQKWEK